MTDETELRACPFCGGNAITARTFATEKWLGRSDAEKKIQFHKIHCLQCGTEQGYLENYECDGQYTSGRCCNPDCPTLLEAITAWNTRPTQTANAVEPVAWLCEHDEYPAELEHKGSRLTDIDIEDGWTETPLYAAPPAIRQPDTDLLREAILAVVAATRDYLSPDGISEKEALSRIIQATDNPQIVPLIQSIDKMEALARIEQEGCA